MTGCDFETKGGPGCDVKTKGGPGCDVKTKGVAGSGWVRAEVAAGDAETNGVAGNAQKSLRATLRRRECLGVADGDAETMGIGWERAEVALRRRE